MPSHNIIFPTGDGGKEGSVIRHAQYCSSEKKKKTPLDVCSRQNEPKH